MSELKEVIVRATCPECDTTWRLWGLPMGEDEAPGLQFDCYICDVSWTEEARTELWQKGTIDKGGYRG